MKVFHKEIHSLVIPVLIGILLVGGFIFFGVRSYWQWQGASYFGEIIRITNGSIVISNAKVGERIIDIGERTIIKRGRQTQQNGLEVGDRIIVVGDKSLDGHIQAWVIRIVENNMNGIEPRPNPGE